MSLFLFLRNARFDFRTSYDLFETKIRRKWFYETGPRMYFSYIEIFNVETATKKSE